MSGTFGLVPQKSKPRRERRVVAFQTRYAKSDTFWFQVHRYAATQDAEGTLTITATGGVWPRGLWRLAP
jgi:hypothetical protein